MKARRGIGVAALLTQAGLAQAQVQQVAITTADADTEGTRSTDASLGVNDHAVLVTTNMQVALYDRNGTLQEGQQVGQSAFPIVPTDGTYGRLFDPRADYDPINDRLWYFYSEDNRRDPASPGSSGDMARVHLAISKQGATLDSLGDADWHRYTGDPKPLTAAGTAFDLTDGDIQPYRTTSPPSHKPLTTLFDLPTMAFDERAMILCGYSGEVFNVSAVLVVVPYEHDGGAKSILDGDRPDESDLTIIRLTDAPLEEDRTIQHYAVQEQHDQFQNASFYIGWAGESGKQGDISLRGLYYDTGASQWVLRQHVDTSGDLLTIDLPGTGLDYHKPTSGTDPQTPDLGGWGPAAKGHFFSSAVLAFDATGQPRIFAAHAVFPDDGSGVPEDQWVVQWYVIDPDLTQDFYSTTPGDWQPSVVAAGRIDGGGEGHFYHPAVGVTEQGVCFIEYSFSDGTDDWPQVRRATLSNSYTSVATDVLVQDGPSVRYAEPDGGWADFADMQADPFSGCSFWSVHTLVGDKGDTTAPSDERDVWLFETAGNCENANLNFDDGTDLYDMALFSDYYDAGARRVDMNTDGTTDAADAALYADAYDDQRP